MVHASSFENPVYLILFVAHSSQQTSWLKNSVHPGEFCGTHVSSNIYSSNVCKNLIHLVNFCGKWLSIMVGEFG